jgi:hypothetical protein
MKRRHLLQGLIATPVAGMLGVPAPKPFVVDQEVEVLFDFEAGKAGQVLVSMGPDHEPKWITLKDYHDA